MVISLFVRRAMDAGRGTDACIKRMGQLAESTDARCCVCEAVIVVYKVWESTKAAVVMWKEWCAPNVEELMRAKRRGVEFCVR